MADTEKRRRRWCPAGHDTWATGRDRRSHCVLCERERDAAKRAKRKTAKNMSSNPADLTSAGIITYGDGWYMASDGFAWAKWSLEQSGALKKLANFYADPLRRDVNAVVYARSLEVLRFFAADEHKHERNGLLFDYPEAERGPEGDAWLVYATFTPLDDEEEDQLIETGTGGE